MSHIPGDTEASFISAWLETETYIHGLTPTQVRQVRNLCRTFYRKGLKHKKIIEERRVNDKTTD